MLEDRRMLAIIGMPIPADFLVTDTSAEHNQFVVSQDPSGNIVVSDLANPIFTDGSFVPLAQTPNSITLPPPVSTLSFQAGEGDDSLHVMDPDVVLAAELSFDGGTGTNTGQVDGTNDNDGFQAMGVDTLSWSLWWHDILGTSGHIIWSSVASVDINALGGDDQLHVMDPNSLLRTELSFNGGTGINNGQVDGNNMDEEIQAMAVDTSSWSLWWNDILGTSGHIIWSSVTSVRVNALGGNDSLHVMDPGALLGTQLSFDGGSGNNTGQVDGNNDDDNFAVMSAPTNVTACDFDGDGVCGGSDIDLMTMEISGGGNDPLFDMNFDGVVNRSDITDPGIGWLAVAGDLNIGRPYPDGDVDLSGSVDPGDIAIWNANALTATGKWTQADINADGFTDATDLTIIQANFGVTTVASTAWSLWWDNILGTSGHIIWASMASVDVNALGGDDSLHVMDPTVLHGTQLSFDGGTGINSGQVDGTSNREDVQVMGVDQVSWSLWWDNILGTSGHIIWASMASVDVNALGGDDSLHVMDPTVLHGTQLSFDGGTGINSGQVDGTSNREDVQVMGVDQVSWSLWWDNILGTSGHIIWASMASVDVNALGGDDSLHVMDPTVLHGTQLSFDGGTGINTGQVDGTNNREDVQVMGVDQVSWSLWWDNILGTSGHIIWASMASVDVNALGGDDSLHVMDPTVLHGTQLSFDGGTGINTGQVDGTNNREDVQVMGVDQVSWSLWWDNILGTSGHIIWASMASVDVNALGGDDSLHVMDPTVLHGTQLSFDGGTGINSGQVDGTNNREDVQVMGVDQVSWSLWWDNILGTSGHIIWASMASVDVNALGGDDSLHVMDPTVLHGTQLSFDGGTGINTGQVDGTNNREDVQVMGVDQVSWSLWWDNILGTSGHIIWASVASVGVDALGGDDSLHVMDPTVLHGTQLSFDGGTGINTGQVDGTNNREDVQVMGVDQVSWSLWWDNILGTSGHIIWASVASVDVNALGGDDSLHVMDPTVLARNTTLVRRRHRHQHRTGRRHEQPRRRAGHGMSTKSPGRSGGTTSSAPAGTSSGPRGIRGRQRPGGDNAWMPVSPPVPRRHDHPGPACMDYRSRCSGGNRPRAATIRCR